MVDSRCPLCLVLATCAAVMQDWGPNRYHATAFNTPTFNGNFMELSSAQSEYLTLPSGFGSKLATVTSFTSSVWIYMKTVGAKGGCG